MKVSLLLFLLSELQEGGELKLSSGEAILVFELPLKMPEIKGTRFGDEKIAKFYWEKANFLRFFSSFLT